MESLALKLIIVGLIIMIAFMIIVCMAVVVKYGKKSARSEKLFELMKENDEQQERLISLLKSRRTAGEVE